MLLAASLSRSIHVVPWFDCCLEKKNIFQGYHNYAELSLSTKMAPNVETVLELTEMLRKHAMPAAALELEQLKVIHIVSLPPVLHVND